MPADLKELRRLHEEYVKAKSALKPKSSAGHLTYDMAKNALVVASLDTVPELLDRLEAAEAENARLREALGEVAESLKCHRPPDDGSDDSCGGDDCLKCMAREALEGR